MGSVLDDPAVVDHEDPVGEPGGLEPVGDEDRGAAPVAATRIAAVHPGLGGEVEVRRRLVEEQDRGIDEVGAGERDELALARRERPAPLAHRGAGTRRAAAAMKSCALDRAGGGLDLGVGRVGAAERDVVPDRAGEEERLLGDDPEVVVDTRPGRSSVDRDAVDEHRARASGRRSGRRA